MKRVKDDEKNCMYFIHSDGTIEIGIYPVLFGFRIRVGYVGSSFLSVDYCAGDRQYHIEEIYSMVLHILKTQDTQDLDVFPSFKVKPIFNDRECIEKLRQMSEGFEWITIPNVSIYKELMLSKLHSNG